MFDMSGKHIRQKEPAKLPYDKAVELLGDEDILSFIDLRTAELIGYIAGSSENSEDYKSLENKSKDSHKGGAIDAC